MNNDQTGWIKSYTTACGVSVDGPVPSLPVSNQVIDCYRRAGRERIAELTNLLAQHVPGYVQQAAIDRAEQDRQREQVAKLEREREQSIRRADAERQEAQRLKELREQREETERRAERDRIERQRLADIQREKEQRDRADQLDRERRDNELREQAASELREKIDGKLKDLGFYLANPIDLELDWRDLNKNGKKIAVSGFYDRVDEIDGLSIESKEFPAIRLYADGASRGCSQGNARMPSQRLCPGTLWIVVGGTVRACVRNRDKLNEHEVPCLTVQEAYLLPNGWQPAMAGRR